MTHEALERPPSQYVGGAFVPIPGDAIVSRDPARPSRVVWSGTPRLEDVGAAVEAARSAFPAWSSRSLEERAEVLRRWQALTARETERIAGLITDEMGKTIAEARFEAGALGAKVDIALDETSLGRVRDYELPIGGTRRGRCRFKPHGVMAVIGPFNFPAHLPNGQFVQALLLGNTVVVKPSEKTPGVGQLLAELMDAAGAPAGVFNVLQGDGRLAAALSRHPGVDGILFTGSWPVGRSILESNLDEPGRIIALELGGNNASIVLEDAPFELAVVECARAAFATTGQRCTCTRRIVVERGIAERFVPAFCRAASTLIIGPGRHEPVFMGPLVDETAVTAVLDFQDELHGAGGRVLVQATRMASEGHFVTPGVVEVDRFSLEGDREVFGPFVQIAVVDGVEEAIEQANTTRYGLAASVFTRDDDRFERCFHAIRAGCINRNTGTAGASGKLPFGGVGRSGNHRPAGAFAADFCAYPVASMVETGEQAVVPAGMQMRP